MAGITDKIKPKGGFSYLLHLGYNALLPILIYILVRISFAEIALILIIISKWRMLAVKPRYWLANIRSNGVDIIVGLSILVFMLHTSSAVWQFIWAVTYIIWLVGIKPGSDTLRVSLQSLIGQLMGLSAIFIWLSSAPLYALVVLTWVVCYLSARHFFTVFEESFTSTYAHTWGYFGASLSWILAHYLLYYGFFAQPTVLLSIIGLSIGSMYYLQQNDRLSLGLRRQIVLVMAGAVLVILVFSNWSSRVV